MHFSSGIIHVLYSQSDTSPFVVRVVGNTWRGRVVKRAREHLQLVMLRRRGVVRLPVSIRG
jgi:hypothetical protein